MTSFMNDPQKSIVFVSFDFTFNISGASYIETLLQLIWVLSEMSYIEAFYTEGSKF